MEILTGHTPTQLLKMLNDIKQEYDSLKQEIINDTIVFDEIEKKINEKINRLTELEKSYVALIEEMEKQNAIQ
jgi:uncharacterized coiled-coil DUF342 family protein